MDSGRGQHDQDSTSVLPSKRTTRSANGAYNTRRKTTPFQPSQDRALPGWEQGTVAPDVPCPVLRSRTIVPPTAHPPKPPQTDRQTLTTSQHRPHSPRASNSQTHPHPKDHTKPAIAGKHLEHCWQKRCSIPPAIAFGAFECISHTLCRLW
jgi:hypothetical protein